MNKATEKRLRIVQRVSCANAFLTAIASHGRKFFAYTHADGQRIAHVERDARGKLWMHNEWNLQRINIDNHRGEWPGFHHGGTLRQIVEGLAKYIREGGPIWGGVGFGCHWGYDQAGMDKIVAEGRRLGIIREAERDYDAEMQLPAGKTCGDCVHVRRCVGMGYSWTAREQCDFWPNKFRESKPDMQESNV